MRAVAKTKSPLPASHEAGRPSRVERIREHYLREAKRIEAFNRTVIRKDRIGFWASTVWLPFAIYFANPAKGWMWDHPLILAFALLIAVAGYRIGASLMTAGVALFFTARGFLLVFDRHFVQGLLAVVLSLVVVWMVWFASDIASQGLTRGRREVKYAMPDQEMFERFAEIEERMDAGKPFGIFLRTFYKETPLPGGSGPDHRHFDAIRNLIGPGDTYSIPDPSDPVHANPFPTAIADPANWMDELNRLLARASWIVLFYEYETYTLDEVARVLEEKYAGKSIAVFGPEVSHIDPICGLLTSACKWSFRLQFQKAEGSDRSGNETDSLPMLIEVHPTFHDWLRSRKSHPHFRESNDFPRPSHR